MKKVLSIVAALLLYTATQAQIVSSRSSIIKTEKEPTNTQWFIRGGLNVMSMTGEDMEDTGSKIGYNFVYGFQKPTGSVGTYWGMEFGLGSRGWSESEEGFKISQVAHNVQVSPFTFGYKYNLSDAVAIDTHLGAYFGFDYAGKIKEEEDGEELGSAKIGDWEDWKRVDAGMNVGVGIWYSRFNLDFTYQRGFIKTWESNTSNVLIRLGIAF